MSNLNHSLLLHQRDSFLKVIEELRYFRKANKSLEEKLESMELDNMKLENSVEDVVSKLQKSDRRCAELEKKLVSYESTKKDNEVEEENGKLKIALEASEETISRLKNHIISYKTSINTLEKKLSECEQKLMASQQSSSLFSSKIEHIRATTDNINKQLEQAKEAQLRLEQNLKIAVAVNKEFVCNQEHLKRVVLNLRREKQDLNQRVVSLNKELRLQEAHLSNTGGNEKTILDYKIDKLKEENSSLSQQLSFLEKEIKESRLREAGAYELAKNTQLIMESSSSHYQSVVYELEKKVESCLAEIKKLKEKSSAPGSNDPAQDDSSKNDVDSSQVVNSDLDQQ